MGYIVKKLKFPWNSTLPLLLPFYIDDELLQLFKLSETDEKGSLLLSFILKEAPLHLDLP